MFYFLDVYFYHVLYEIEGVYDGVTDRDEGTHEEEVDEAHELVGS